MRILPESMDSIMPLIMQARKETKRSYRSLAFDLFDSMQNGYTFVEYFTYGFAINTDEDYRNSFYTIRRHYPHIASIIPENGNNREFFDNKLRFNKHFREFRKIESYNLQEISVDEWLEFANTHDTIYAKVPHMEAGLGVFKYKISEHNDLLAMRKKLLAEGQLVIEEEIIQDPVLNQISPNAVTTVRMVTIKTRDNKVKFFDAISRISINESYKDNNIVGAAFVGLSKEGKVEAPYLAFTPELKLFDKQPAQNFPLVGFLFPEFEEAKKMVVAAHEKCEAPIIGWDVAFSTKGPMLLEANRAPAAHYHQIAHQMDGHGRLAELEELFEEKIPSRF